MTFRAVSLVIALLSFTPAVQADFALRDGDTLVFLGDSITAARQYSKIVENYTLLRFPERKIRFINAGHGGETAQGCLQRLQSAVFDQRATVVTVAYGVNDIGWGMKADEAHKESYLHAIGDLIDRCRKQGVRVFICSAAITAEAPDSAERGFLQKMCDEGLALAKSKGAGAIDVQRSMRAVQRRVWAANNKQPDKSKQVRMHAEDGIHLNDLGQMAMAFAILKGLGAPADVSEATIDAAQAKIIAANNCQISDLKRVSDGIGFTRRDDRLPLNLAPLWMLHAFYMPIGDGLNRYGLRITGLAAGKYEVIAGGRALGRWSAADLGRGINLASASMDPWEPGGVWSAQAYAVKVFTDMRDEATFARRQMDLYLTAHPRLERLRGKLNAIEQDLVALQRETARPVPVRVEVRKIGE